MKFASVALGVLVMAVAGCAGPGIALTPDDAAAQSLERGTEAAMSTSFTPFGTQRAWHSGLSMTIAPPQSLRPSETAFPQAPRAAVFTVTIFNGTKHTYRPSQLAVRALAGGRSAPELLDSVQGLNGIAAAVDELPPARDTTLTLAFAVPEEHVHIRLTVLPNGAGQEAAVFEGQA